MKEKVIKYIEKLIEKEKDKWESGLKNSFFRYEDDGNKIIEFIKENLR